jgi:hypothetical protein
MCFVASAISPNGTDLFEFVPHQTVAHIRDKAEPSAWRSFQGADGSLGAARATPALDAGVRVTSVRYHDTVHHFVMLNALADACDARGNSANRSHCGVRRRGSLGAA